jgi:hypothetical protein
MSLNPWELDCYSQDIVKRYIEVEQKIIDYIIDSIAHNAQNDDISDNSSDVVNYANALTKYGKGLKKLVHGNVKQGCADNLKPVDQWISKHEGKVNKSGSLFKKRIDETDDYMKLISHNMSSNSAAAVRQIITSATNQLRLGDITKQQAVSKALHQWLDHGIPALIDDAGKQWSPETYVRTVVQTQTNKLANEETLKRIKDNKQYVDISSHVGARPLCAPYQGQRYSMLDNDPRYPSFYSTSYGKAAGILGINCHHHLLPVANDGSVYNPPNIDSELNQKVYKQTQQQRKYEREIRKLKNHVKIADKLDDDVGKAHYYSRLRNKQTQLRSLLNESGLRNRPERVKNILKPSIQEQQKELKRIAKHELDLKSLQKEFGPHGLPKTVDEYREVLYNIRSNTALHGYVSARRRGVIEPVYTYQDYQDKYNELDNRLVGLETVDGQVITGFSNHAVERSLGALHDESHGGNKRIAISTSDIQRTISNGKFINKGPVSEYLSDNARVTVSSIGKIITIAPKRRGSRLSSN